MSDDSRAAAIALYDRFTHEERRVDHFAGVISDCRGQSDPPLDRRAFMAELTRIAGSTAAASALLLGIAASPAAAAIIPVDDKRLRAKTMTWRTQGGREMKGYVAEPAKPAKALGSVLVVHENRGLNEHIRDVARRLAVAGYRALAPDFLSVSGGTPADEDQARAAIGKLDLGQSAADAVSTLAMLKALPRSNRKAAIIGFCWGGGMVHRVAVAAGPALAAGTAFYGPAPDPALAPKVEAAIQMHLAGLDERVNKTALPWADALKQAGVAVEAYTYPGVNHAFHNDTSAERYDRKAAELAWSRTLAFLGKPVG